MESKEENLSRIVGLWLAEGSNNSTAEITFTNSQVELLRLFHEILIQNFVLVNRPRIYVYRRDEKMEALNPIAGVTYRYYFHPLCRKPFYIYRVSGTNLVKEWNKLVDVIRGKPELHKFLLQGFFAGEGNIKYIESARSRVLRMAQGERNDFIEHILRNMGIDFAYSKTEKSYVISGYRNLSKLWDSQISILHPLKHEKFRYMFKSYKQLHFRRGELSVKLLESLQYPSTSKKLARFFSKSQSRVSRELSRLALLGQVRHFRVGSLDYWIRYDSKAIVISRLKSRMLAFLKKPRRVYEVCNNFGVTWKSSFRRLKELKKLNLVVESRGYWKSVKTKEKVIVL